MNKLLISLIFFLLPALCFSISLDEAFDINDAENRACQKDCSTENVREASEKRTYNKLFKCNECQHLFELCIQYRICEDSCVPAMPVLPYKQALDMSNRVRAPINPCLDLVSACNFESMDSYEILRSENPFLFI